MIKWKDFLYFSKGDRIAIILLLILIVLSGGICLYLKHFSLNEPIYAYESAKTNMEFKKFEEQLVKAETISAEDITKTEITSSKKERFKTTSKLTNGQTVDINNATEEVFVKIPGIGNVLAQRIINYRDSLRGFASIEQLTEIKGITISKLSKILPYIVLKKNHRTVRVNKDQYNILIKHPYISEEQAQSIVKYRVDSKIATFDDLLKSGIFTPRELEKLTPYISYN